MKYRQLTGRLRLYGKNRKHTGKGSGSYWTDIQAWTSERRKLTGQDPFKVNVTSRGTDADFANLSPMRLGPVFCYLERDKSVVAVNLEVAWQYSKVYSHVIDETGKLIDVRDRFLQTDARGKVVPTAEWFRWRDAAYNNPKFVHTHPEFSANKKKVRRAFPKGSRVACWYWGGQLLNAVEARLQIYARLYQKLVRQTEGYRKLRDRFKQGNDLLIYDLDGYDWQALQMSPMDCVKDLGHSFGHGMVLAFMLQGICLSTHKSSNN